MTEAIQIDCVLSRAAALATNAEPFHCWSNAAAALLEYPPLAGGVYVEGFLTMPPYQTIGHGWVELRGVIVDPTCIYFPPAPSGVHYLGVLRLTTEELYAALALHGQPPYIIRTGRLLPRKRKWIGAHNQGIAAAERRGQ
jgi:hypothetical protein